MRSAEDKLEKLKADTYSTLTCDICTHYQWCTTIMIRMRLMIAAHQEKEMLRISRRWCRLIVQRSLMHHGSISSSGLPFCITAEAHKFENDSVYGTEFERGVHSVRITDVVNLQGLHGSATSPP